MVSEFSSASYLSSFDDLGRQISRAQSLSKSNCLPPCGKEGWIISNCNVFFCYCNRRKCFNGNHCFTSTSGVVSLFIAPISIYACCLCTILFVRKLRLSGAVSPSDLITFRYGAGVRVILTLVVLLAAIFAGAYELKASGMCLTLQCFPGFNLSS